MKLTYRPLGSWTEGNTLNRRYRSAFKASWDNTMRLLRNELELLAATNVVLQLDVREQDIRADGTGLLAHRDPAHPGVRVGFDSAKGPITIPCDSCEWWRHNVRSIALGLEALRAVDRYGIAPRGEQYAGWRQIEARTVGAATGTGFSVLEAATYLAQHGNDPRRVPMDRDRLADMLMSGDPAGLLDVTYRRALRAVHPDTNPDNHHTPQAQADARDQLARIREAKRVLDAHHGTTT